MTSLDQQPTNNIWPYYAEDELDAVCAVLRSGNVNYWTGDECRLFEREFAEFVGMPHGVALANGSVALELALRAFDIGPGDEVIVTPRSFIASASCAALVGATPVFADVDADSQNITAETIEAVITPRTKAIVAVHLAGWPCEMDDIAELADRCGLKLIEDCAQAHGAEYRGRRVGSFGDAAAFSFCQDKIISTGGEGGMLLLRDEAAWKRAWAYKDHGRDYDAVYHENHPPGHRWLYRGIGTNWRMTEIQGAIGRIQLRKLPDWLDRRRSHAAILRDGLSGLSGLRVPSPEQYLKPAYYRFYAFILPEKLRQGWSRDLLVEEVANSGVPCFQGSCGEIYREQAFAGMALADSKRLPVARQLHDTSLSFLVHPTLGDDEMKHALTVISRIVSSALS